MSQPPAAQGQGKNRSGPGQVRAAILDPYKLIEENRACCLVQLCTSQCNATANGCVCVCVLLGLANLYMPQFLIKVLSVVVPGSVTCE